MQKFLKNIRIFPCMNAIMKEWKFHCGTYRRLYIKSFLSDLISDCKQKLCTNDPRSIIVVTHCGCSHYLMQLVAEMIPNLNPQMKEDCDRKWPLNTAYSKFKIKFDSDQNPSLEICFLCCSDHLSN